MGSLKRLYGGKWTRKEVLENSCAIEFAKALPLGRHKERIIRNIGKAEIMRYNRYKKVKKFFKGSIRIDLASATIPSFIIATLTARAFECNVPECLALFLLMLAVEYLTIRGSNKK